MYFVFTLEPFVDPSISKEQTGTTYYLAKDAEFKDVIHTERIDLPGSIYKFVYEPLLEPDKNYYIKARRHFSESNLDHDTPAKIIRYDKDRAEALIFNRDVTIETPWVYVDADEILDPKVKEFTLRTSKFKSNLSGHVGTHWIITDGSDVILWTSLEDTKNLTSITIPKDNNMLSKTRLKITAIHIGDVGIESDVSTVEISLQKFNFEVVSDINGVEAGVNYDLTLRRLNQNANMNISKVDVIHPTTKQILYSIPNNKEDKSLTFTLPWNLFQCNTMVRVIITALDVRGDVGYDVIDIRTALSHIQELEDTGFKYENKIGVLSRDADTEQCDGVYTMEIPEGYIPMSNVKSRSLYKYKFEHGELVDTGKRLKGVDLLSSANDNIFIKYTENNLLLVDGWRDKIGLERDPVFLIYRHDVHTDTYDFISMIDHPLGDKHTAASNGGLVQITPTQFLYLPIDGNNLYRLDIIKNSCELVQELPHRGNLDIDHKWFMRMPKQRLYVQCSDESYTFKYEILKNEFERSISVNPRSFSRTRVITRMLPNGDNLLVKPGMLPGDTDGGVITYNYNKTKFIPVNIIFGQGEYPTGSILLLDNSVLLTKCTTDTHPGGKVYVLYRYV